MSVQPSETGLNKGTQGPLSQDDQPLKSTTDEIQHPVSQYLDVPLSAAFRPSIDTTYSELSIHSNELLNGQAIALVDEQRHSSILRPPRTWRAALDAFWLRNKGVFYVLLSQFFGSCMNLATRILENPGGHGTGMHPFQLLFVRQFITCIISTIYCYWQDIPYFPLGEKSVRPLLIVRGLGGFFGVCGLYYSLVYLPISEAVVLTFLGPMLSCYVYSFIQPSEPFTRPHQIAALVSMLGVLCIAQPISFFSSSPSPSPPMNSNTTVTVPEIEEPQGLSSPPTPTPSQHLFAVLIGLVGVVGGSIALTSIRYIGKRAHPLVSIWYFSTWCTIVSLFSFAAIPGIGFKLPENLTEWGLLLFIGINGFFMQILLTAGMAYSTNNEAPPLPGHLNEPRAPAVAAPTTDIGIEPLTKGPHHRNSTTNPTTKIPPNNNPAGSSGGSRATSMLYTQMLFALAFDKIFWDVSPTLWSWLGSGLIFGSVIWVAVARDKPPAAKSTLDREEDLEMHGMGKEGMGETEGEAAGHSTEMEGLMGEEVAGHVDEGSSSSSPRSGFGN